MGLNQTIIDLYDRYTHGAISRREFMDRLTVLVGGTAAAQAILPLLASDYALAQTVPENDPRLQTETFEFESGGAAIKGLLARPAGAGTLPGLVVIHENRGLNPHIRDVTRRFALDGFLAYGIDALSPEGGTPEDEDRAREMIRALPADQAARRIAAGVTALSRHPGCTGKVGTIGYCWGGGMVSAVASLNPPGLGAGVSYYGRQVPAAHVASIQTPLLLHYAGNDPSINAGIEDYRKALTEAGKTFEIHVYEGTQHAFNNDTGRARYDAEAAKLALERSLAFLRRHLA